MKCRYKCYLNHRITENQKSSENVKIELRIACHHDKASDSSTSHSSDKPSHISVNETADETPVSLSSTNFPPHTGMCNFTCMITECKNVHNYIEPEVISPTEEKVKHKSLLNSYVYLIMVHTLGVKSVSQW